MSGEQIHNDLEVRLMSTENIVKTVRTIVKRIHQKTYDEKDVAHLQELLNELSFQRSFPSDAWEKVNDEDALMIVEWTRILQSVSEKTRTPTDDAIAKAVQQTNFDVRSAFIEVDNPGSSSQNKKTRSPRKKSRRKDSYLQGEGGETKKSEQLENVNGNTLSPSVPSSEMQEDCSVDEIGSIEDVDAESLSMPECDPAELNAMILKFAEQRDMFSLARTTAEMNRVKGHVLSTCTNLSRANSLTELCDALEEFLVAVPELIGSQICRLMVTTISHRKSLTDAQRQVLSVVMPEVDQREIAAANREAQSRDLE
jgi:hypothetical protein